MINIYIKSILFNNLSLFKSCFSFQDQWKLSTWHPRMLETLNVCLEEPILRIYSGYHSNCRIRAMISCGKFVAERTLKGSIGSLGATILQLLIVWHLDKEQLIGVNFTQSKDNNRTSLYIKMCDQKVRIFNCNQCLRVLMWVFVKTDFILLTWAIY